MPDAEGVFRRPLARLGRALSRGTDAHLTDVDRTLGRIKRETHRKARLGRLLKCDVGVVRSFVC